jgi:hypothetical protein
VCGVFTHGSHCQHHVPERITPTGRARAQFRAAVLHRAGFRCQWISAEDGSQCAARVNLEAHHLRFSNTAAMRPEHGVALCRAHFGQAERAVLAA